MEKSTHTAEYASLLSELRSTRANAGFSQRELAARLKVPHSWVAKAEIGERRVDLVELCWFISACGADPVPVCNRLLHKFLQARSRRNPKGGRTK